MISFPHEVSRTRSPARGRARLANNHPGWKIFFESLWPRYADKIAVVRNNIDSHKVLMDDTVTVNNISDAYVARCRALEEYEKEQSFRERQEFEAMKTALAPRMYEKLLWETLEQCSRNTSQWIHGDRLVKQWLSTSNASKVLWLSGIPGAGKYLRMKPSQCSF